VFYAFDLLWLDGEDLPAKPLIERKRMLKRLLPPPPSSPILYAQHVERTGIEFYRLACDRDLESVVAKLKRRRIRPGLVQDSGTRAIRRTKPA
jgi:bifunctional non-homologous end joining protein LigD